MFTGLLKAIKYVSSAILYNVEHDGPPLAQRVPGVNAHDMHELILVWEVRFLAIFVQFNECLNCKRAQISVGKGAAHYDFLARPCTSPTSMIGYIREKDATNEDLAQHGRDFCPRTCKNDTIVISKVTPEDYEKSFPSAAALRVARKVQVNWSETLGFRAARDQLIACTSCKAIGPRPLIGKLGKSYLVFAAAEKGIPQGIAIVSPYHCRTPFIGEWSTTSYVNRALVNAKGHYEAMIIYEGVSVPPFVEVVPPSHALNTFGLPFSSTPQFARPTDTANLPVDDMESMTTENMIPLIAQVGAYPDFPVLPSTTPKIIQDRKGDFVNSVYAIIHGEEYEPFGCKRLVRVSLNLDPSINKDQNHVVVEIFGKWKEWFCGWEVFQVTTPLCYIPVTTNPETITTPPLWVGQQVGATNCRNTSNAVLFGYYPELTRQFIPPCSRISRSPVMFEPVTFSRARREETWNHNRLVHIDFDRVEPVKCGCAIVTLDHSCSDYPNLHGPWKDIPGVDKPLVSRISSMLTPFKIRGSAVTIGDHHFQLVEGHVAGFGKYIHLHLAGNVPTLEMINMYNFGGWPSVNHFRSMSSSWKRMRVSSINIGGKVKVFW